jgi:hypothetical protein
VQRSLDLGNELLSASSQDQSTGLGLSAALEKVETLASDLLLLKGFANTQVLLLDICAGRLNRSSDCLDNTVQVSGGDTSGAENVAVSKVLGGQISDGQLGQDNLGASGNNCLQLIVNNLPLCINNLLVLL